MDRIEGIALGQALSRGKVEELEERGFIVVPGPIGPGRWLELCAAYDEAMHATSDPGFKLGSTTARLYDFVNRGPAFDSIYLHPPLLEACVCIIGEPFKLSANLGRSLLPHTPAQALHADLARDSADGPMVGFILMVDEFRRENGATRFVPNSHRWAEVPPKFGGDPHPKEVLADGPAGSMIVFNAAIWHGHSANSTGIIRRSIQGYFVRRGATSAMDFRVRTLPETAARLSPLAHDLLCLKQTS